MERPVPVTFRADLISGQFLASSKHGGKINTLGLLLIALLPVSIHTTGCSIPRLRSRAVDDLTGSRRPAGPQADSSLCANDGSEGWLSGGWTRGYERVRLSYRGTLNAGLIATWIANTCSLTAIYYSVADGGRAGDGIIFGIYALGPNGRPAGQPLCTAVDTSESVAGGGGAKVSVGAGLLYSDGVCSGFVVGRSYGVASASSNPSITVWSTPDGERQAAFGDPRTPFYSDPVAAKYSTEAIAKGRGAALVFTEPADWVLKPLPSRTRPKLTWANRANQHNMDANRPITVPTSAGLDSAGSLSVQ